MKKLFKEGELQNMEDIKTFATQYVVKAEMVNDYIKHLKILNSRSNCELQLQRMNQIQEKPRNMRTTIDKGWFNWETDRH